jgi:shikimate kinase
MKQLIILVGPKGSGKTYIGTLIHEKLGIAFLRVEDIWLSVTSERFTEEYVEQGFRMVEEEIDRQLRNADLLLIESTGASAHFAPFLSAVGQKYSLILIKINASPVTCRKRIKTRDVTVHIPVSDDIIEQINKEATKVDLEFDAVIDNENTPDEEILELIRKSIAGKEHYWAFLNKERGLYWNGVSHKDRNLAIHELEEIVNRYGFITDYHMFSDMEISFHIEIVEQRIPGLIADLKDLISLEGRGPVNAESEQERSIYLRVTFLKGTGNLEIHVPSVPG